MNRRNIPGYYFDAEKGKYFKIQANHQASPANTKYARSEVNRERRDHKKQKTERRQLQIRHKQTVKRATVLNHVATAGIALDRELGLNRRATNLEARDAFRVSQLRVRRTTIRPCPSTASVTAIVPLHTPGDLAIASSHSLARSTVEVVRLNDYTPEHIDLYACTLRNLVGFNSSVVSIVTAEEKSSHSTLMVACAASPLSPGNVYWGTVPNDDDRTHRGVYLKFGEEGSSLWAASLQQDTLCTAIVGTNDVFVLDPYSNPVKRSRLESESRAVAWLDHNTITYGQHGPDIRNGGVHLWDIRSSGKTFRFPRKKPITSLTSLGDGLRMLVCDNNSISLYDTRLPKLPLFSLSHLHQGPQLQSALLSMDILAALDVNNIVQTYSLRAAAKHGALSSNGRFMSNLVSRDTDDDPILFACQDNSMLWWARADKDTG